MVLNFIELKEFNHAPHAEYLCVLGGDGIVDIAFYDRFLNQQGSIVLSATKAKELKDELSKFVI